MKNEELVNRFKEIEAKTLPISKFLNQKHNNKEYKPYKGFITNLSPLVYQPEILFIGINPGDGAYKKAQGKNKEKAIPPIKTYNSDKFTELNWFEDGNARAKKEKGKNIKGYKWYQRNKSVHNIFAANMIDLLYHIAERKYGEDLSAKNSLPDWYESLGKKVMFTNIYPIATTNIKDLDFIISNLSKEDEIRNELFHKEEKIDNWGIRKYFIRTVYDMIKLLEPKILVCLGFSAFKDLTYTPTITSEMFLIKNKVAITTLKNENCLVIGFKRSGNWSSLLPSIAKAIVTNNAS
jgi:hypothetical protein